MRLASGFAALGHSPGCNALATLILFEPLSGGVGCSRLLRKFGPTLKKIR